MTDAPSSALPALPSFAAPSRLEPWPPVWEPAAVVFDCDGLLVDTEAQWIGIQDAYLARHGKTIDPQLRRELTGRRAELIIQAIADIVGKDFREVGEEFLEAHRADVAEQLSPMPGALDLVRAVAARKPVAVASNSPRELLDPKIAGLGLSDVVDATVAIEDVDEPKPAPDMYAVGARMLGADPAEALALEDSETGSAAALGAGLQLIVVPSIPGQDPAGHLRLTSLEDPTLHAWVESWSRTR